MSTYNTAVFVVTKSIADTLVKTKPLLKLLGDADLVESNQAQTVWTWNWIESNQLTPLYEWIHTTICHYGYLEEHFMFLRTGESDEDVEVIGLYDCGYRIGIIPPKPYDSAMADMLQYIVESEYGSFLDYIIELRPEFYTMCMSDAFELAMEDESITHIWKTARTKLNEIEA